MTAIVKHHLNRIEKYNGAFRSKGSASLTEVGAKKSEDGVNESFSEGI